MLKHILLCTTVFFLWSCGGGENSSKNPITEPVVINPPREVGINLTDKFVVDEKSSAKVGLSLTGSVLASDKVVLTVNSQLVKALINSDLNEITINTDDVNLDTDVKIKVTIEGPSNTPSKEITLTIKNNSANQFILELSNIIDKAMTEYNYTEELHVANMLSLISASKTSDIEGYSVILKAFQTELDITQNRVNEKILQYSNAIKKYQERSIDEIMLRSVYASNDLSKSNYNLDKISALNKLLLNLSVPIEFPQNTDGTESNFWGNLKIGSFIGGQFFFNKKYYYLNSILEKTCIGS